MILMSDPNKKIVGTFRILELQKMTAAWNNATDELATWRCTYEQTTSPVLLLCIDDPKISTRFHRKWKIRSGFLSKCWKYDYGECTHNIHWTKTIRITIWVSWNRGDPRSFQFRSLAVSFVSFFFIFHVPSVPFSAFSKKLEERIRIVNWSQFLIWIDSIRFVSHRHTQDTLK